MYAALLCSQQVVAIPAGRTSELLLALPAGARLEWRWAVAAHDVAFAGAFDDGDGDGTGLVQPKIDFAFAVDCCEAPEALPSHVIRVASSLRGLHALAPGYAGPILHHTEEGEDTGAAHAPSASASAAAAAPAASIEGRTPWMHAVPAARHAHSWGAWTAPSDPATLRLVRLRWDNGSSWLHSKTLSRRVDVILAGALDDGEGRCPASHRRRPCRRRPCDCAC